VPRLRSRTWDLGADHWRHDDDFPRLNIQKDVEHPWFFLGTWSTNGDK
jgi:hypothetical protein